MGPQCAEETGRAPLSRFAARAVVLAVLGTALWFVGQAAATAEELMPPSTAAGVASSVVDAVATPGVGLLAPATSAVDRAEAPVAPAVGPAPAVVAPVAAVPVVPLVSAVAPGVHSAVVPATDLADPIVQTAEPVLQVAAPLRDVAAPVVATVEQALETLTEVMPLAGALSPQLTPVAGVLDSLLGTALTGTQDRPDADFLGLNEVAHGLAAGPAGAGRGLAPASEDVSTPGPGGAGGVPGPVQPPTPVTRGSTRSAGTGTHSFDQSPAYLPANVLATITAALAATGDARDAAGNIAADPSFSPD